MLISCEELTKTLHSNCSIFKTELDVYTSCTKSTYQPQSKYVHGQLWHSTCTKQEVVSYNLAGITGFAIRTIENLVYVHCIPLIPNMWNWLHELDWFVTEVRFGSDWNGNIQFTPYRMLNRLSFFEPRWPNLRQVGQTRYQTTPLYSSKYEIHTSVFAVQ